jgi:hypothetical protein
LCIEATERKRVWAVEDDEVELQLGWNRIAHERMVAMATESWEVRRFAVYLCRKSIDLRSSGVGATGVGGKLGTWHTIRSRRSFPAEVRRRPRAPNRPSLQPESKFRPGRVPAANCPDIPRLPENRPMPGSAVGGQSRNRTHAPNIDPRRPSPSAERRVGASCRGYRPAVPQLVADLRDRGWPPAAPRSPFQQYGLLTGIRCRLRLSGPGAPSTVA